MLTLRLPKSITIANNKLTVFYWTILFLTFVGIVLNFFINRSYSASVRGRTRLYVSLHNSSDVMRARESESSFYEVPFCLAGDVSATGTCVGLDEAFVQQSATQVFLASSWRVGRDESEQLLPSVGSMFVQFHYNYETVYDLAFAGDQHETGTSSNVTTRIVDAMTMEPLLVFEAGDPILISAPMLVELASGAGARAHGIDYLSEKNRRSGLELVASVNCKQTVLEATVCDLRIELAAKGASITRLISVGSDQTNQDIELVSRTYKGLRMRCETGSFSLEYFSFFRSVIYMATAIVYMSLPNKFLLFFATNCLGHLSVIYHRAIRERFDVVQDTAHVVLRLLTSSVHFADLAHLSDSDGITKHILLERLRRVLENKSDIIQEHEVQAMSNFVFHQLVRGGRLTSRLQQIGEEFAFGCAPSTLASAGNEHLSIDTYSEALSSHDKINFSQIVNLFDKDRHRKFFEKLFTPRRLTAALWEAAKIEEQANSGFKTGSHGSYDSNESLEQRKSMQWKAVARLDEAHSTLERLNSVLQKHVDSQDILKELHKELHKDFDMRLDRLEKVFEKEYAYTGSAVEEMQQSISTQGMNLENIQSQGKDAQDAFEQRCSSLEDRLMTIRQDILHKHGSEQHQSFSLEASRIEPRGNANQSLESCGVQEEMQSDLRDTFNVLGERVDELQQKFETFNVIGERVDQLQQNIETLKERIDRTVQRVDKIQWNFEALHDEHESLQSNHELLNQRYEQLHSARTSEQRKLWPGMELFDWIRRERAQTWRYHPSDSQPEPERNHASQVADLTDVREAKEEAYPQFMAMPSSGETTLCVNNAGLDQAMPVLPDAAFYEREHPSFGLDQQPDLSNIERSRASSREPSGQSYGSLSQVQSARGNAFHDNRSSEQSALQVSFSRTCYTLKEEPINLLMV